MKWSHRAIEPVTLADWESFDAQHPAPTFFARPAWSLALTHAYPHLRPYPIRVATGKSRILIPMMQASGGRLRWSELIGMPLGAYTCGMHDDGTLASPQEFARAIALLCRVCDAIKVTPWPVATWQTPKAWKTANHETSVIDVSNGAEEALNGVTGVSRRMAGQAERRGVVCEPCQNGLCVTTYYAMLRDAAERWRVGRPSYPKELLEALVGYGGDDVEIWFAYCDGHPIAGGVVLYGSQELFFWSAAMRHEYARLRASNALNVALIRAAADRGVHWYNLGASEGLPGVERFKRGLGARSIVYSELRRERVAFAVYSRVRASLQRDTKPRSLSLEGGY
jgi:CelD/BcsL family acetyltransferase involved in cellulose biosynthesis